MLHSIRSRLILIFVGLALIPMIFVVGILTLNSVNSLENETLNLQKQITLRAAAEIDAYLQERTNELVTLNKIHAIDALDITEQQSLLANLLAFQQNYQELTLLDAGGNELIHLSRSTVYTNQDLQSRRDDTIFREPASSGDIYYSPVMINAETREPLITIAIPIQDLETGNLAFVLAGDVRFRPIWDIVSTIERLGEYHDVYVTDTSGRLVAHADSALILAGTRIDIPDTNGRRKGLLGNDVVLSRQSLNYGSQELIVIAERPAEDALKITSDIISVALMVTGVALIFAIGSIIFIVQQILKPIQQLSATAQSISHGDLSSRAVINTQDEFGDLANAFNRMTDQLKTSIHDLQVREEEYRSLVENHPDYIAVIDRKYTLQFINSIAVGHRAEDYIGKNLFDILPDEPAFREAVDTAFENAETTSIERQGVRMNGEHGFFAVRLIPLIDNKEVIKVTVVSSDITDQKEAQAILQQSHEALEVKIADRTRNLQLAAEVSRQITTELNIESLIHQVANLTKEGFHLRDCVVHIINEDKNVLEPIRNGLEGDSIHSIEDDTNPISKVARECKMMLVDDVNVNHTTSTHSQLLIPMMLGDQIIGVFDCQSEQPERFNNNTKMILKALADQTAVAIRNAQLFSETHQARIAAEDANRVKAQFLATMSHELRTPLNAILNFTLFIASGMYGEVNAEQVQMLNKVAANGEHLLQLINNILDMSKIDADSLVLFEVQNINLEEELRAVMSTAESLLNSKPIELILEVDSDLSPVNGDQRRIRQIILNLVSNACKFTERGSITVNASNQDDYVVISVTDTGPGIPEEDQTKVFQNFWQAKSRLAFASGTGLGLAISKKLTESHGGKLWVESKVGQGSTFFVALPRNRFPQN